MKYLVLECHLSYAVVLDEAGRFIKAANRNYRVGETVTDIVEMNIPQKQRAVPWIKQLSALAACLVLAAAVSLFAAGQMTYASVYMAINPEVRIDVNRWDRVVSVEGVNDDGRQLLVGYEPGRQELDLVMDELVDRAIDQGYLHEGGTVTLTLDGSEKWVSDHGEVLNAELENYLTQRITVTIDIESTQPPVKGPEPAPEPSVPGPVPPEKGETNYEADTNYDDGQTNYGSPYSETDYDSPDGDSGYDWPEADTNYDERSEAYDSGYNGHEDDTNHDEPHEDDEDDDAEEEYDDSDYEDS